MFTEHTAPERLYLETQWASLVSFGLTAQRLKEVLPIGSTAKACTFCRHRHRVIARHKTDLGDRQPGALEDTPAEGRHVHGPGSREPGFRSRPQPG